MKIGNINSITNATFIEPNGNNTIIVHKNDCVITFDMVEKDMNRLLDELRNSKEIEDSEKEIISEAEKCVHNEDQVGLIEKLKRLGKKRLVLPWALPKALQVVFFMNGLSQTAFNVLSVHAKI